MQLNEDQQRKLDALYSNNIIIPKETDSQLKDTSFVANVQSKIQELHL